MRIKTSGQCDEELLTKTISSCRRIDRWIQDQRRLELKEDTCLEVCEGDLPSAPSKWSISVYLNSNSNVYVCAFQGKHIEDVSDTIVNGTMPWLYTFEWIDHDLKAQHCLLVNAYMLGFLKVRLASTLEQMKLA